MIRLPIFILLWILFLCIKIPTLIAGLFVVPFLYKYRSLTYNQLPDWTRPWSNPEDWHGGPQSYVNSLPKWWVNKKGANFKSFYIYYAIRNGANGLRSFEFLDLDIIPEKVKFKKNLAIMTFEPSTLRRLRNEGITDKETIWYFCWQGWQAGFKLVHIWNDERHLVIKLGWRIQPSDTTDEIDPEGIRHEDAGFATKFLPYRKG